MKKFAILTDSCCDLDRENRARFDVDYLPMRMLFNERDLPADLDWADVSFGEFYRMMRDGILSASIRAFPVWGRACCARRRPFCAGRARA